ncbi:MAG: hypothetical protein IJ274_07990 [Lachnospiraceae bacterium]|nr:hypothetical protein [Lachnospiraceae bacterium]
MNCIKRQWKIPTYIKYFLSYFFIVTVLVLSFFFVIRSQLVEKYFNQQVDVARMRLDVMAEKLNEDLTFLMQIDSSIEYNTILLEQRYGITNFSSYIMKTELEKYDTSSLLISDIVYYSKRNDCMVSTSGKAFWKDGKILIEGIGHGTLMIDPTPCWEEDQGKIVSFFDENQNYLIYFPDLSKQADYIFFYFLDSMELVQRLQSLISLEV